MPVNDAKPFLDRAICSQAVFHYLTTNDPPEEVHKGDLLYARELFRQRAATYQDIFKPKAVFDSILSPLRHFPFEILSLIFSLVCDRPYDIFSLARGPWALAKVCSTWRSVALQSPRLWANMFLDLGPRKSHYRSSLVAIFEEALHRGRRCRLFRLIIHGHFSPIPSDLVALLAKWSWRCESLYISSAFPPSSSLQGISLPSVVKLHIASHRSIAPPSFNALGNLDSLRELIIDNLHPSSDILLDLPSSLKTLRSRWDAYPEDQSAIMSDIIAEGTGLVDVFFMQNAQTFSFPEFEDSIVTNHSIRRMTLVGNGYFLINSVTLPSLTHLNICAEGCKRFHESAIVQVLIFVVRSGCSLTHLSLDMRNLLDPVLGILLSLNPKLKHVSLTLRNRYNLSFLRLLFNRMTLLEGTDVFRVAPQLEMFVLRFALPEDTIAIEEMDTSFVQMLEARRSVKVPVLGEMSVFTAPKSFLNLSAADIRRLHNLKKKGFSLHMNILDRQTGISTH